MAITAQTPYTNHMGNGTTTIFAYTFTIFDESDMAVYVDGILKTLTTDYSISNVGSGSGGNVTFVSAPTSGKVVRFVREMPYDREVDYQTSGDLLADTLDNDLDRLECQIQQLGYAIDRAMSYPNSDASSVTGVLPSATDRAEKVLYFDSTGKPTAVSISVFNNIIAGANYVVDAFTGDGVTKNFVLSIAPGTRANTDVHIDGVYQNKEGYALTDTVLTFSEAPYSGADIEVVSGDAIPEGFEGNATAVRYVPSGTGAVETNVAAKLSETVSVKDFGAVGDGVTDDTAAIQAAIDADCTTLPLGNFVISSGLTTDKGLVGQVGKYSILELSANSFDALTLNDTVADFQRVSDLSVIFQSIGTGDGIVLENANNNVEVNRVNVQNADIGVSSKNTAFMQRFQQVRVDTANTGFYAQGFNPAGTGAGTTLIYDQCYCTNGVVTGWDLNNIRSVEMIQPTTDMAGMTTAIKCFGVGVLNVFGHHFEGTPGANGSYIEYTTSGNLAHGINIIGGALEIANLSALTYSYLNIQANDDVVRVNLYGVNVRNLTGGTNAYLAKLSGQVGSHIEIIAINCNFGALENLFDTSTFNGTYNYRRIDQEVPVLASGSASVAGGSTITTGVSGGTDNKVIFVQVRNDDGNVPTVAAHVVETYSGNSNIRIKFTKLSDGTVDTGTYTVNWQVLA